MDDANLEGTELYEYNKELINFPFPWSSETTADDFNEKSYREFLASHRVLHEGLWRAESPSYSTTFGDLVGDWNPYVLPVEGALLDDLTTPAPSTLLANWREYYQWAGLSLTSPICILLQWPLTLYFILTQCLHRDYPTSCIESELCIHIIGVEKEADLIPVFQHLTVLMPGVTFDLSLIGQVVSRSSHGKVYECQRMKVTLYQGQYHRLALRTPHVAIGFNAGLPAYTSWIETVKYLQIRKVPAYLTDYCRRTYELSLVQVAMLSGVRLSGSTLNPFRSPIRVECDDTVPRFSNALLFHLVYQT